MAEQKNIKTYIYLGIILVIFVIAYFLVYPAVLEIKNTQKDVLVAQKTLDQKRDTFAKFKEVSEKYKAKKADLGKIKQMLSPEPDIVFQLIQFEALANNNGMIMDNISFGNLQAAEKGEVGVFPIDLKVNGSYVAFKNYLEALAKNLSLIDVETINFQIGEAIEEKEIKEGYSFSLKVNTYTEKMPEKPKEEQPAAEEE